MLVSLEVNFTLSTKLEEIHLAISLIETNLEGGREGGRDGLSKTCGLCLLLRCVLECFMFILAVKMYTVLFINIDIKN